MSKLQTLKRQVTREAGMIGGGVVLAFVVSMGTGYLAEGAAAHKMQAQGQFNQAQSQLGVMRGQISKSDDAEKRYVDIRLDRDNDHYLNNTDEMKNLLKDMKEQYRFADSMRLTISGDKPSQRQEFLGLNYNVIVREDMEISTAAISDVHVFSFLEDMKRRMPGMVRIKNFRINRKSAMTIDNLTQLGSGNRPEMVDATIKFTWLTLEDKNPPKTDAATPESAPAPVPAPGVMP